MARVSALAFTCLVSFVTETDGFIIRGGASAQTSSVRFKNFSIDRSLARQYKLEHDFIRHVTVQPEACDTYMKETGCGWTSEYRCPPTPGDQELALPIATNDGSVGYRCCCDLGLYKPEEARKGAAVVLRQKTARCKDLMQQNDQLFTCEFTGDYACPDQYRSDHHVADAGGINDDGYMCCCVLGQWRNGLKNSLRAFRAKLNDDASRNKLMFVKIPANAGAAIEEAASQSGIWYPRKFPNFDAHKVHMPDGSDCDKVHVPPAYFSVLREPDQEVFRTPGTFCVTQHPYERAVFEYLYLTRVEWGPAMSEQYRTELLEFPKCTAKGLNHFLQHALLKVLEGRKFLHDCHFVPQHEYIFGHDGRKWCNNELRIDTLPRDFNELMESYGDQARMALNRTEDWQNQCGGNITRHNLDAETRLLLQEVYADDFELLNYTL